MAADSVPVLVVTGFAGAGKTTLVNRLLAQSELRVGVIAHRQAEEFGIAPHAIEAATVSETVYDFGSGCICCSPKGELSRLLYVAAPSLNVSQIRHLHQQRFSVMTKARQHGQNGRLGSAAARHHGLLGGRLLLQAVRRAQEDLWSPAARSEGLWC